MSLMCRVTPHETAKTRRESGQVTVLVIGLALVVIAVSGLAVDGTRAFLMRRTLQNAADAAVLEAAGSLNETAYYRSGGTSVVIDSDVGTARAIRSLRARGIDAAISIRFSDEGAVLVLRDEIPTTFLRVIGVVSLPVAVEAVAAPVVDE